MLRQTQQAQPSAPEGWRVNLDRSLAPDDPAEALRRAVADEIRSNRFPIPPLPQVAVELNRVATSPEPELKAAIAVIQRDPQLAGRVLDLASSAALGARAKITDLNKAVLRVGASGLRDLAFAVMMGQFVRGELQARVRAEMQQAFVIACATQHICRVLRLDSQHGFLCGLLADVGRLAMLAPLAKVGKRSGINLDPAVVDRAIDVLHPEVSGLVISRWGLSRTVRDVARFHHQPREADAVMPLALAVSTADFALHLEAETPTERAGKLAESPVPYQVGLGADHLDDLAQVVEDAMLDAGVFFGKA